MTQNPFGIIVAGALVGVCVGLIGTSGAIMIPVLVYGFGLTQLRAQGTSLFIALLPVWIAPVIPYARAGNVQWKLGLLMAAGLAVGSYFGATWAQHLPMNVVRKGFAVVLGAVAVKMFLER